MFTYASAIRTMHFDKNYIGKIIIPKIGIEQQKPLIDIVEKIISLKKQEQDTSELENQIDEMVYDLYELTEEEKEIVRQYK